MRIVGKCLFWYCQSSPSVELFCQCCFLFQLFLGWIYQIPSNILHLVIALNFLKTLSAFSRLSHSVSRPSNFISSFLSPLLVSLKVISSFGRNSCSRPIATFHITSSRSSKSHDLEHICKISCT